MNERNKFLTIGIIAGIGLGIGFGAIIGSIGMAMNSNPTTISSTNYSSIEETVNNLRERLDIYITKDIVPSIHNTSDHDLVNTIELHRIANNLEDINKNLKFIIDKQLEEKGEE